MASSEFEQKVQKACDERQIAGFVLVANSSDGKFRYEKSIGNRSLKTEEPDPLQIDATMWLASCTKFPVTVAAMQCVEKGLLKLDEDVTRILPEYKELLGKILVGWDKEKDEPVYEVNEKAVTLRHLLSHQSGIGYAVFNPVLARWATKTYSPPTLFVTKHITEEFKFPLLFAPGQGWEYSVGIDWAGLMVERVTGTDLESYLHTNVWGPVGGGNFTFHPKSKPSVLEKMTDMSFRSGGLNKMGAVIDPHGKVVYTEDGVWNPETPGCQGGAGYYGSPKDYAKLLHSFCAEDEKVLKKSTVDEMCTDQLTPQARGMLQGKCNIPELREAYGGPPEGLEISYGLGGMVFLSDVKGGRRKGTLNWGGYPNLAWFIDRKSGMSGILGSQLCPPGDPQTNGWFKEWEQEIYKKAGKENL
ncbi:beta-lactamase/transpeptidase-like protein [Halenospora varia]|nr:beta-lactamase/transpeptidase-like protein [Halenospora varia]